MKKSYSTPENFSKLSTTPSKAIRLFLMVLFVCLFANINSASAATRTASVTGNWNSTATWGGFAVPVAGDAVIINSGITVTVNIDTAVLASLTMNSTSVSNGITINSGITLNAGDVTINSPNTNNRTVSISVGSGTLNATSISIAGSSTTSRKSVVSVSTGTINVTGNISLTGTTPQALITFTGAGNLNIGGNLGNGATFTASTGTVNYNNAGAQNVGNYTYKNLTLSGSGTKTWTQTAARTITGNLKILDGSTLSVGGAFAFTVTGTTIVGAGTSGTLTLTNATGTKTFTGAVTINAGGTWDNTGNSATSFAGGITHNGNTFNNGTGAAAFSATQSLLGSSAMTFGGSVTPATSTTLSNTNSGIVTINNIVLTGGFKQGLNTPTLSLINQTPFSGAGTFDASTNENTVNYSGSAQTIKATQYSNLILSGSETKTLASNTTVNNITINTGVTLDIVTSDLDVSGNITLNGTCTSSTVNQSSKGKVAWNPTLSGGTLYGDNGTFSNIDQLETNGNITIDSNANITFNNASIDGQGKSITNNGIVNVTGTESFVIDDALTWNNIGTLNYGLSTTPNLLTLQASTSGNTVNYTGTDQTIKATTYNNLSLSGSGTKTFEGNTTVGALTIDSGVVADLKGFTNSVDTLTLAESEVISGSWGSTASTATNKNDTYFSNTSGSTGVINVNTTKAIISGTATICNGSSTNLSVTINSTKGPFTVIYSNGSSNITVNSYISGASISVSPVNTTTYTLVSIKDKDNSSLDTSKKSVIVTVNATLAEPSHSVTQPTLALATGSVTFTGLPASGTISYAGTIGLAITGTTQTISGLIPENYSFTISNGTSPCTFTITGIIINEQPIVQAPSIVAIQQPNTCADRTGTVELSGLPEGNWTINPGSISGTGATKTISGLKEGTYNFTVTTSSGYTSSASVEVEISLKTNVFNNGVWSKGTPPTVDQNINLISGTITTDITACSCKVLTGSIVVVQSGKTITLTNELTVVGTGSITFENNASLVQINDVENSGHITYQRTTSVLNNNYDFVYWSSPVKEQKLGTIWMASNWADTFYNFNPAVNNWGRNTPSDKMVVGKGYIARARSGQSGLDYNEVSSTWTAGGTWTTKFHGVPNNGTITNSDIVGGKYCLLGNPYPSALNANAFLSENSALLEGTIYFWTHNTAIENNAYKSNDYAAYNINLPGGVATQPGANNIPTGNIAAGQGFFAKALPGASGAVTYKNTMRVASAEVNNNTSNGNSQFYKTTANQKTAATSENSKIWLNLTNSQGLFKQTLIGYVTGATNAYEKSFDGVSMNGNAYADFYSFTENKKLTIQGRALPLDTNDTVPLGFKTTINGDFKISIAQVDGLLIDQAVYIEDKLTNKVVDLKSGDYTFTTVAGTFNDRFVLTYVNNADGTDSTKDNQVFVSTKNKEIKINSATGTIDKVLVYDLLGRVVYEKNNVSSTEFTILNLEAANQNLVVKAILENGATVTNKIIF